MVIFITATVFLFVSAVSCTSVCLVCDGAIDARDCPYVMTCGTHEQCYIDAFVEPQGLIRYNLGCRDSLQCVTPRRPERSTSVICSACCQGDMCNARECGQKGFFTDRGPLCYSCSHMKTETDCGRIEQCSRDQICTLHPINATTTDVAKFHSGCTKPDICSNLAGAMSAIGIGKRSSVEDFICNVQCCTSDLCNSHCSNSTSSHLQSTQLPPTTSTSNSWSSTYIPPSSTIVSTSVPPTTSTSNSWSSAYIPPSSTIVPTSVPPTTSTSNGWSSTYIPPSSTIVPTSVALESSTTTPSPNTVSTQAPGFPTDVDPCLTNPCMRGSCVSQGQEYNCVCDAGFTGLHCEHVLATGSSVDACSSSPCVKGTCEPHGSSYICHCHQGYWGRDCELVYYDTNTSPVPSTTSTDIVNPTRPRDPCDDSPCGNGTCESNQTSFTCTCHKGFSGIYCDQDIRIACRQGWFRWDEQCYYFDISKRLAYNLAVAHCRAFQGANLVHVESQEENDFLKHFMQTYVHQKDFYWIGITDAQEEGVWKYSYTNDYVTYLDFLPTDTTDSHEDCAVFNRYFNYTWTDTGCYDTPAHPVCEKAGYATPAASLIG